MLKKSDFEEKEVNESSPTYLSRRFGEDDKYELCIEALLYDHYYIGIYEIPVDPLFEKIWCEDLDKAIAIASAIDLQIKGCPNPENLMAVLKMTVAKWAKKQNVLKGKISSDG